MPSDLQAAKFYSTIFCVLVPLGLLSISLLSLPQEDSKSLSRVPHPPLSSTTDASQLPVVVPYNQVAISRESVTSSSMYNSILMYLLPFSTKLYMTALKPTHLPPSGLFETSTFPRLLVYAGCVTSLVHAASPSPYSRDLYALPRHSLLGGLGRNTAAGAHLTRSRSLRTLLSRR
jgi:hypothetical protein